MKKILIFIIILIIIFGLYLVYNYSVQPVVRAPITVEEKFTGGEKINKNQFPGIPTSSDFHGPSNPPSINGPSGPPPLQ